MHLMALSSLRTFFRPILRLLGMSSPPPPDVEFPVEISVVDWLNFLLDRYCSQDPKKSPMDRSRMKSLKVTTICRYKEKMYGEHEYLIAEVSVPDLDRPRYLRIERTIKDPLPPISTTSFQSSVVALKEFPACDDIKTMEAWPTSDICIDHMNCKNTSIILLDLAIVAKLVRDHSDKYQLFKRQCFWYSDVIVAVLQNSFSGIQVVRRNSSVEADHAPNAEMEIFDRLSGTFKTVPFYQRRKSVIKEIGETFSSYRPQVYSSVYFLNFCIFLLTNCYIRFEKPHRLLSRQLWK
jgi:hypothetical protein